jgi:carbamoyl-phosphate synthase small subunit
LVPKLRRRDEQAQAVLVLEDGSIFSGHGFGAAKQVSGEVVFSTSMTGYPETLTDPSYKGQILVFTYPLIGNYGVPPDTCDHEIPCFFESGGIKVSGLVVHELCESFSHWDSSRSLGEWLESESAPGVFGVDTRKLVKKLRTQGVLLGVLEVCQDGDEPDVERLLKEARAAQDPNHMDLVKAVTVKQPVYHDVGGSRRVVLVDCGVKYGILRCFLRRGIDVVRVPYDFSSKEILEYKPDAVVLSNGPGDPKNCGETIECVKEVIDERVPVMGICLGTQVIGLSLGGDTYKLKYGHRSQNQPVLDLRTGRCYITTQNHGYALEQNSLEETGLETWFTNANDGTVEGIRHRSNPVVAFQWHPEAEPGPYDTEFLFDEFLKLMVK